MAKTMTKLTLKFLTLIILVASNIQAMAKSPWADEEPVAAEPVSIDSPVESQTESSPVPAPQPVTAKEPTAPVAPAPTQNIETFIPEAYTRDNPQEGSYQKQTHQGDVLNIDQSTDAIAVRILDFPRRGMSTDKVKNELGQPGEIISGIGQPPISRWIYDDRTVYFEYSTVLHVVAR